jgi:hypothetical protein
MSIAGFVGSCGATETLIGGSSAFNLDRLDIKFDVFIFCSRLSKDSGLAGNVILDGADATPKDVGIIVERIVVDCGMAMFKFAVVEGMVEHIEAEDVEVAECKEIVFEGIVLTLENSAKFISTRSSYKLCENESVSFPGRSRKLVDVASGTGGGIEAVNWKRLSAFAK